MGKKKDYEKIGREVYRFNFDEEFEKYKYFCCEKVNKKDRKKYDSYSEIGGYNKWENDIIQKYSKYNRKALKNFIAYLRFGNTKNTIYFSVIAVFLTAILAAYFSEIINEFSKEVEFIKIVSSIIVYVIGIGVLLCDIHFAYKRPLLKERFFNDYIKVIEKIRKSKKKNKCVEK